MDDRFDGRLEPGCGPEMPSFEAAAAISAAVSLKRIADILEGLTGGAGLEGLLTKIANHPTNIYGEGFADAIQNGIERGQRGISTWDRPR